MSKGLGITAEEERIAGRRREDAERQTVAEQRHSRGESLKSLLEGVQLRSKAAIAEIAISQVTHDSRKVQPGALFVAIPGVATDGTLFARDAVSHGAIAVVSEASAPADWPDVAWVQVGEARKALAITAANFFGRPGTALKLTGVTGTNGKTTTTSLIDSILRASGAKTGLFGTISYHTPSREYPAPNTTPESVDLQNFFAEIRDAGGSYATMEASSHALAMGRLWGCHFASAVFTNLTRDHIDFHKNFENYFAAKRRLFEGTGAGEPDFSIVNTDDEWGKKLVGLGKTTLTYGLRIGTDLKAKQFPLSFGGLAGRTKRRIMGHTSGKLSDLTILTSDNPRQEDPLKIISDIVVGMQKSGGKYLIEPDRAKAISLAIEEARPGDIVLLAGKGHEDYQIFADRTIHFDDREVARKALNDRGYKTENGK